MDQKHVLGADLSARKGAWISVQPTESSQSSRKDSTSTDDGAGRMPSGRLVQLPPLDDANDVRNRLHKGRKSTCCCIKPGYEGVIRSLGALNAAIAPQRSAQGVQPPREPAAVVVSRAETLLGEIRRHRANEVSDENMKILDALREAAEKVKEAAEREELHVALEIPASTRPSPRPAPAHSRRPQDVARDYADLIPDVTVRPTTFNRNTHIVTIPVRTGVRSMLFKPADLGLAGSAGTSARESKWAQRSAAAWRVACKLNLDVIPLAIDRKVRIDNEDRFGILEQPVTGRRLRYEGRLRLGGTDLLAKTERLAKHVTKLGFTRLKVEEGEIELQRLAPEHFERKGPGEPLERTRQPLPIIRSMDWSCAGLRRKLTQLQWLDTVLGEDGRHHENIVFEHGEDGSFMTLWGVNTGECFRGDVERAPPWPDPPAVRPVELEGKHEVPSDDEPPPPPSDIDDEPPPPPPADTKGRAATSSERPPPVSWRPAPPRVVDRADLDALQAYFKLKPEEATALLAGLGRRDQKAHLALRAHLRERVEQLSREAGAILNSEADWSSDQTADRLGLTAVDEAMTRIDKLRPPRLGGEPSDVRLQREAKIRRAFNAMHVRARATSYVAREAARQRELQWCQKYWRDRPDRVPIFGRAELQQALEPWASSSSSTSSSSRTTARPRTSSFRSEE